MFLRRGSRALRRQWRTCQGIARMGDAQMRGAYYVAARDFHSTKTMRAIKPVLLADIGEGMRPFSVVRMSPAHVFSQALSSARSSSGLSSRKPESKSSHHYAKSRATKRPSRSQAGSPVLSRSYTTMPEKWPKSGSHLWILI